jgi:hypothetical protein
MRLRCSATRSSRETFRFAPFIRSPGRAQGRRKNARAGAELGQIARFARNFGYANRYAKVCAPDSMKFFFEQIDSLSLSIPEQNWDKLEESAFADLSKAAGEATASSIRNLNTADYAHSLAESLERAYAKADELTAAAVYFEYDIDNNWSGHFFVCQNYFPQTEANEDWACDWLFDFPGPSFSSLSELVGHKPMADIPSAARTVYAIARTVAIFGRACAALHQPSFAVCIGFHDQDPIFRILDASRVSRPTPKRESTWNLTPEERYFLHNYSNLLSEFDRKNMSKEILATAIMNNKARVVFLCCPQCGALARTPRAKQCSKCGHAWR